MTRVGYLVSDYHAASHTFVRREVAALQALSWDIVPFSVQGGDPQEGGQRAESLLGRSLATYAGALLWACFTRFTHFIGAWRLACTHRQKGIKGALWAQFHLVEAMVLARSLKQQGIVRLHNHFANSGATVGLLAAHVLNIPWSLTLHGISETDSPAGALLPAKLVAADFVACASYFMQAQAMRLVDPVHWPKCHIVRCGIDLNRLPAPKAAAARAEQPPQLLCVGRLSPEKGYFGLLDSLSRLQAEPWSLTIIGAGPADAAIRQRLTALGLDDRITMSGGLNEADTLNTMAQADAVILPSLMEGLPVVLIEALALGKPALASRIAGIPELIEEGITGALFTPSDWDDLEHKLRAFLSHRASWSTMGEQGRKKVVAEFQSQTAAARMAALFNGVSPS